MLYTNFSKNSKILYRSIETYKDLRVFINEIARITKKSRSTIYRVLKEELGYVSNILAKNRTMVLKTQLDMLIVIYYVANNYVY